jgi:hypothetical protein
MTEQPTYEDTTTLRNQFAAAAITGILANKHCNEMSTRQLVDNAFDIAEIMEREAIKREEANQEDADQEEAIQEANQED